MKILYEVKDPTKEWIPCVSWVTADYWGIDNGKYNAYLFGGFVEVENIKKFTVYYQNKLEPGSFELIDNARVVHLNDPNIAYIQ